MKLYHFQNIAKAHGLDALIVRLLDNGSLFASVHAAGLRLSDIRVEDGYVVYPASRDATGAWDNIIEPNTQRHKRGPNLGQAIHDALIDAWHALQPAARPLPEPTPKRQFVIEPWDTPDFDFINDSDHP